MKLMSKESNWEFAVWFQILYSSIGALMGDVHILKQGKKMLEASAIHCLSDCGRLSGTKLPLSLSWIPSHFFSLHYELCATLLVKFLNYPHLYRPCVCFKLVLNETLVLPLWDGWEASFATSLNGLPWWWRCLIVRFALGSVEMCRIHGISIVFLKWPSDSYLGDLCISFNPSVLFIWMSSLWLRAPHTLIFVLGIPFPLVFNESHSLPP